MLDIALMTSLKSRQFSHSELNFSSSWKIVTNTIKLCRKFILHKINKNMKRKPGMKYIVHWQVWRHIKFKLCNFITSLKLIKTPKTFVQSSFFIKLIKMCHKNSCSFGLRSPLKIYVTWIIELFWNIGTKKINTCLTLDSKKNLLSFKQCKLINKHKISGDN